MSSNVFLYLLVLIISISLHYVLNSVEIVIIIGRVRYDSRATQRWLSLPIGPIKLTIIIITNIIYKTKALSLRTCISLFLYIIYIINSKILPSSSRFTCILKSSIIELVVCTRDRVRVWTCISITGTYIVVIVYFLVRWVGGCVLVYTLLVDVVFMNLICLLYLTLFLKYISLYRDIFNSFILINWNVVCYWI